MTDQLQRVAETVHAALATLFEDTWPQPFAEASRYPLFTGGKRVRPALCFAMHDAICGPGTWSTALVNVATSVELIHTYSLVHDDLPCLDNDDERRGRPTVHIAYDEGTALLVGDALLTEAFALLARQPLPAETVVALIQELSTASGHLGMIGGQAADIGLNGPVETLETLKRLHRLKTGALLTVSATMGARVAQADPDQLLLAKQFGETIGLAFQLADDVLDAEEDAGSEGPPSYVKFLGQSGTSDEATRLMNVAVEIARQLPHPEHLIQLAHFIVHRDH